MLPIDVVGLNRIYNRQPILNADIQRNIFDAMGQPVVNAGFCRNYIGKGLVRTLQNVFGDSLKKKMNHRMKFLRSGS